MALLAGSGPGREGALGQAQTLLDAVDSAATDISRAVAADLLSKHGRTPEALDALLNAARKRWWNSPALRERALLAAQTLAPRLGKKVGPGGELEG